MNEGATNTTTNYAILTKVGVEQSLIAKFVSLGIKMGVTSWKIKFMSPSGAELSHYTFAKATNTIMKGLVDGESLEVMKGGLTMALEKAIKIVEASGMKVGFVDPNVPGAETITKYAGTAPDSMAAHMVKAMEDQTMPGAPILKKATKAEIEAMMSNKSSHTPKAPDMVFPAGEDMMVDGVEIKKGDKIILKQGDDLPTPMMEEAAMEIKSKPIKKATTAQKQGAPVALVEATMMYQPVLGTSQGSRYFVVGIRKGLKVAARIKGYELSVRVEGAITKADTEAFSQVGVTPKGGYLSGHFQFTDEAPAARVLGAILMGTNLEFETPMPVAAKVAEFS